MVYFTTIQETSKHKNFKTDCRYIDITADRINIIILCKIRRRTLKSYLEPKGRGGERASVRRGGGGGAYRAPNGQSWGFSKHLRAWFFYGNCLFNAII